MRDTALVHIMAVAAGRLLSHFLLIVIISGIQSIPRDLEDKGTAWLLAGRTYQPIWPL